MPAQPPPTQPDHRSSLLPFALAILVGLIFLSVVARRPGGWADRGELHPAAGKRLTELQLAPLINTRSAVQLADLKGKVALINFWGPWCTPCRIEMPHLVELQREFSHREDFRLISVSCAANPRSDDSQQLREETADFVEEYDIQFAVYRDPTLRTRLALIELAELGDFGYPTTVVLDEEQSIRGLWVGYAPGLEKEIRGLVLSLLRQ